MRYLIIAAVVLMAVSCVKEPSPNYHQMAVDSASEFGRAAGATVSGVSCKGMTTRSFACTVFAGEGKRLTVICDENGCVEARDLLQGERGL